MAVHVNQKGYDVVSKDGERISVKTTATTAGGRHVAFNANSLNLVDRVLVLRINTEEMQVETLLDAPVSEALALMTPMGSKRIIALSRLRKDSQARTDIKSVTEVAYEGYVVKELETGSIELTFGGQTVTPVLPGLRKLAQLLNLSILNSSGNAFTTRQLGSQIIKTVVELRGGNDVAAKPGDDVQD